MNSALLRSFAVLCLSLLVSVQSKPYSKYGRTCKDIGCLNNEICVMAEDPCNYGSRECGRYPTCKTASPGSLTCDSFACPNGQECNIVNDSPSCVNAKSHSTHVRPSHSDQGSEGASNGGSSGHSGGSLYPSLYPGGTTSRPSPHGNYPPPGGNGYTGGAPGSGYPGSRPGSGYPGSSGGYPGSSGVGYPGSSGGYPGSNGGYPGSSGGYPGHGGGYPGSSGGYPGHGGYNNYPGGNQGYPGGYPNQGYPGGTQYPGYNNRGGYNNYPGTRNEAPTLTDKITDGLKTFAGNYLQSQIAKAIQGR